MGLFAEPEGIIQLLMHIILLRVVERLNQKAQILLLRVPWFIMLLLLVEVHGHLLQMVAIFVIIFNIGSEFIGEILLIYTVTIEVNILFTWWAHLSLARIHLLLANRAMLINYLMHYICLKFIIVSWFVCWIVVSCPQTVIPIILLILKTSVWPHLKRSIRRVVVSSLATGVCPSSHLEGCINFIWLLMTIARPAPEFKWGISISIMEVFISPTLVVIVLVLFIPSPRPIHSFISLPGRLSAVKIAHFSISMVLIPVLDILKLLPIDFFHHLFKCLNCIEFFK